jgi:GNAT superfamily N-acetyltransferase
MMSEGGLLLKSVEPILSVPDVPTAIEWYQRVLAFPDSWMWGEPATHGCVCWGKVGLQFSFEPNFNENSWRNLTYIFMEGVGELHALHLERGADIISPLELKPWGMREYSVRDLNGYVLRIGECAGAQPPPRGELPENFRIERCAPDVESYARLIREVKWTPYTNFEVLHSALQNAVAGMTAFDGETVIGCALLVGDSATFYYVKDVMVSPPYQNRGVGTALMRELMSIAEEIAPTKSLVGLFTGANLSSFYEKFGFHGPEFLYGMSRRIRKPKSARKSKP